MKKSNLGAVVVVLMVLAFSAMLFSGCGNAKRDDCKKACQKLYDCEVEKVENAEDAALDQIWLTSCKAACDEADDIRGDIAECIINTACDSLNAECKVTAGSN